MSSGNRSVGRALRICVSPASRTLPGGVVWFVNEEVDRYESFGEFFGSMVNYNAIIAKKLSSKRPWTGVLS
jgi:hypothetical protein